MKKTLLSVAIVLATASSAQAQVGYQQYGNTTRYNNGVTAQQYGNTTQFSNGVTAQQYGNTTQYSNGVTA
jgi:hypothetical protein